MKTCFATVYVEGAPQPAFSGITQLAITTEARLRKQVRAIFPQVRKLGVTVLGESVADLPAFFRRTGGRFLFPQTEPRPSLAQVLETSVEDQPAAPRPRKKVAPKVSRKKRGHSPRKIAKATRKACRR